MAPPPKNAQDGSDRDIHRLFDGDLSASEIETLIEAEKKRERGLSGTRVKIEALGDLRALVREATSDASDPIDADAAWAQIAARIEGAGAEAEGQRSSKTSAPSRPALRVIEGGLSEKAERRDEERPAEHTETAPPGLIQRIDRAAADRDDETKRREQQVRQRRSMIMVVSGFAAAAAAAIAFLGPAEGPAPTTGPEVTSTPPATTALIYDPPVEEQLHRTEVIAVDFGANAGTVFSVEGTEGSRYAVVWLTDAVEDKGTTELDEAPAPDEGSANL